MHPHRLLGSTFLAVALAWAPSVWANPRAEATDHMTTLHEEGLDAPEPAAAVAAEVDPCAPPIRGVGLLVSRTPAGATLTFTSPNKGTLPELRTMLRETAVTLEYHSKLAALHPELLAAGADVIPPVDVTVKDSPTGAQITLRAEDPHDASRVQAHVVSLEKMWDHDKCVKDEAQHQVAGVLTSQR